jgi:hypothetical protein
MQALDQETGERVAAAAAATAEVLHALREDTAASVLALQVRGPHHPADKGLLH